MARLMLLLGIGLICLSKTAFCQVRDSIFLYNGQVLIGAVQGANLGTISIDDRDLKMQKIKLYKIKTLKIYQPFKIGTVQKELFHGFLKASNKPGWIIIVPDDGPEIPTPIINLALLISLEKNFFKRLDGNLSAGLSYTKSSGIGQVNFSTSITFATKLFEYQLSASELASIDSSKISRDNESAQLFVAYDLTASWFLSAAIQYQRNLELSLARRYLGMTGIGNKLIIKKDWQILAVTGLSYSQEKSTENVESGLLLEIPLMFRFNYYQFSHPDIQISSTQTVYFSLTQSGRVRYDGTINFSWQLIRYFYLTINPYSNYDSKPPSTSGSTFDFGIVVSISYKF
jgi:Protein of unknown function, DUF481